MVSVGTCYNRVVLCSVACAVAAVGILNSLVDPIRLLGTPWQLESLDPNRDIGRQTRSGKAGIIHSNPEAETVLVGSSRVAIGLQAEDPAWGEHPTLNLGLPCGMQTEDTRVLHYALQRLPQLDWVVYNYDFGDLTSDSDSRDQADFFQSPFADSYRLEDRVRSWIGGSAIEGSIDTLKNWRDDEAGDFSPRGDWTAWDVTDLPLFGTLSLPQRHANPEYRYGLKPEQLRPHKVAMVREALAACLERKVRVTLITMPLHALAWTWPGDDGPPGAPFETERRLLVDLIDELRAEHPDASIEWWDFSVFHPITTERFPPADQPAAKPEFWADYAHPSHRFGSIMAARIAGTPVPDHPGPPIGVRVEAANLEDHLASLVAGDREFHREQPETIEWLRQLIEEERNPQH